jgi:hypothetical protein
MADSGNHGGMKMWPSEEFASRLYDWANVGLIGSLAVGVVSTALLVWMGNVKESYLKTDLGQTKEKAERLENSNLTLRGQVAGLERDAADAKTRQAEAEIQLAKVLKKQEPRWIPTGKFVAAFGKAHPGRAFVQYQSGNPEIAMFASGSITPALVASGWHLEKGNPQPIPSAAPQGIVAAMSEVFLYTKSKGNPSDPLSPVGGLNKAFTECGFRPTILSNDGLPVDTVLIVIGPKI